MIKHKNASTLTLKEKEIRFHEGIYLRHKLNDKDEKKSYINCLANKVL